MAKLPYWIIPPILAFSKIERIDPKLQPYRVIPPVIRYYKGIRKGLVLFRQPAMKTCGFIADDGWKAIVPIRLCWKNEKKEKKK